MTDQDIIKKASVYAKKNRFFIYVIIAICLGYTFGKDLAMKHNAQDAVAKNIECEVHTKACKT